MQRFSSNYPDGKLVINLNTLSLSEDIADMIYYIHTCQQSTY